MRSALIVSLLALLLMACGQTGLLYLPNDTPPKPAQAKSADGSTSP